MANNRHFGIEGLETCGESVWENEELFTEAHITEFIEAAKSEQYVNYHHTLRDLAAQVKVLPYKSRRERLGEDGEIVR